jgi:hypothetical protein
MRSRSSGDSGRASPFRPNRFDLVVAGAVLLLTLLLSLLVYRPAGTDAVTAVVSMDGEELMQIDLSKVTEHTEYPVDSAYPLIIAVEPGRICVLESDCPGKDCVRVGWISQPGRSIVCLPNRLVVTLVSDEEISFDAVTG